jgi:hypothetical protein
MPIEKPQYAGDFDLHDAFVRPADIAPNVKFEDLAPEEQERVLNAYRFSGFRPGTYQGPTGIRGSV